MLRHVNRLSSAIVIASSLYVIGPSTGFGDSDKSDALGAIEAQRDYERNMGNDGAANQIEQTRQRVDQPHVSGDEAQRVLQDLNVDLDEAARNSPDWK